MQRHQTVDWIKPDRLVDISKKSVCGFVAPHFHEFYELELILSGKGIYSVDGHSYEVEPKSLFLISPASFHQLNLMGNCCLINLMFEANEHNLSFLCNLFSVAPFAYFYLKNEDYSILITLLEELERHNIPAKDYYISAVINCLLAKICQISNGNTKQTPIDPIQPAILYLQNHFFEPIKLEDVAAVVHYSPNYFGTLFSEYTGIPFSEYLTKMRYSFAEKLLSYTSHTATEICLECGFRDYSNFTTGFKKRFGISPLQYRHRAAGDGSGTLKKDDL